MRPLIKGILFLGIALFVCGCGRPAAVGVIDIEEIFQNAKELRDVYNGLQKEKRELERRGQEMLDEINTLVKESELLSKEARVKRERRIKEKTAALEAYRRGATMDLMERTNAEYRKIMGAVKSAAEAVAKKRGLAVVMDKSAVAYSDRGLDVTTDVIAELDRRYERKQKKE